MRRSLIIARRDFFGMFVTPRAYVLLGAFGALCAFYFYNLVSRYNFLVSRTVGMQLDAQMVLPSIQSFVVERYCQMLETSFVFLVPILAMRALPEERSAGSYELLRTSPLSVGDIVLGKFLAITGLMLLFCVLAALCLASLFLFGDPDRGQILSSLLGVGCCGLAYSALAMLVAARTTHQVTAAVSGIVLLAIITLMHTPAVLLAGSARHWLLIFSPRPYLDMFYQGVLSAKALVYFGVILLTSLWATQELLKDQHSGAVREMPSAWWQRSHGLSALLVFGVGALMTSFLSTVTGRVIFWCNLLAGVSLLALVLVSSRVQSSSDTAMRSNARQGQASVRRLSAGILLGLLSILASGIASFDWQKDLTASGVNTLSDYSMAVLKQLKDPIEITYYLRRDAEFDRRSLRLAKLYQNASPGLISLREVDSVASPAAVTSEISSPGDLFTLRMVREGAAARARVVQASESEFSAAIASLLLPNSPHVYVLVGNGGPRPNDEGPLGLKSLISTLSREQVQVSPLPYDMAEVPFDAAAVLMLGPREPLLLSSAMAIRRYLDRGGKMFVTVDPPFAQQYLNLFEKEGVAGKAGAVIDREQLDYSGGGLQPLITRFSDHPLVNSLGRQHAVIFQLATAIDVVANTNGMNAEKVLFSSPGSSLEPRVPELLNGQVNPREAPPIESELSLGVAVSSSERGPQLVVVGDTDWILNNAISFYGNRALAVNAVNWLLGRSWALVPRRFNEQSATVAMSSQSLDWFVAVMVVLVELIALLGVGICALRGTGAR